jgi:predicted metalloprotease with PDZ domain
VRADAKVDAQEARRELDGMREQMRELSKKMAEMSAKLGDVGPRSYAWRYIGDQDRGMIGVVLSKGEHGTQVDAVTPGGPADKAGVKNGDVIVKVRGEDLEGSSGDSAKFLNDALRNLKVGQEVTLTLQRDGKNVDAKVKAERREPFNFVYSIDNAEVDAEQIRKEVDRAMHDAHMSKEQAEQIRKQALDAARQGIEQGRIAAEQGRIYGEEQGRLAAERGRLAAEQGRQLAAEARRAAREVRYSTPWWGLNLASLNPDLGGYFGADHGALVLSADVDGTKALKSGDVLLAIDGKKIERPEDAMRLLREGETGRDIKVEVLRQHKTQTLSMKAPEFKSLFVPAPPAPPLAPMKPVAPLKPIAPMPMPNPQPNPNPRPLSQPAPPAPPTAPTPPQSIPTPAAPAPTLPAPRT